MRGFYEIDEFWRSMMKLVRGEFLSSSRNLSSLIASDQLEPYFLRLDEMIASSRKAEKYIQNHIAEQKRKFPKLYMFNRDTLYYIFSQTEISAVFEKLKGMLELTELIYDKNDPCLTTGAICGEETILFKSSASCRSSIVDWLRGIDLALSERLKYDIREFMEKRRGVLDDIKMMTSIDQARLCAVQLEFWKKLEATDEAQLRSHLEDVLSQMRDLSDMIFHLKLKNQRMAIYNMILMNTEQKDLLQDLLQEAQYTVAHRLEASYLYNGGTDFILACHIQKKWVGY